MSYRGFLIMASVFKRCVGFERDVYFLGLLLSCTDTRAVRDNNDPKNQDRQTQKTQKGKPQTLLTNAENQRPYRKPLKERGLPQNLLLAGGCQTSTQQDAGDPQKAPGVSRGQLLGDLKFSRHQSEKLVWRNTSAQESCIH